MASEAKQPSTEDLAKLRPINVAPVHASNFRLQATSNEFILLFQRILPMIQADGSVSDIAAADTVAAISMSPQSMKDLSILLSNQMKDWEKEFGPVETSFTRSLKKS
jgi:hypothetical protein